MVFFLPSVTFLLFSSEGAKNEIVAAFGGAPTLNMVR